MTFKFSLGLAPSHAISMIVAVSIIMTCLSYVSERRASAEQCRPNAYILLLRALHFALLIFNTLYLLIFDSSFDVVYVAYTVLMYVHWIFLKNECILTYLENRYYDADYRIGENARANLYVRTLLGDSTDTFMMICGILSVASVCAVVLRLTQVDVAVKATFVSLFLVYVAFMASWKMEQDGVNDNSVRH